MDQIDNVSAGMLERKKAPLLEDVINAIGIDVTKVLNVYLSGSRVYGTATAESGECSCCLG